MLFIFKITLYNVCLQSSPSHFISPHPPPPTPPTPHGPNPSSPGPCMIQLLHRPSSHLYVGHSRCPHSSVSVSVDWSKCPQSVYTWETDSGTKINIQYSVRVDCTLIIAIKIINDISWHLKCQGRMSSGPLPGHLTVHDSSGTGSGKSCTVRYSGPGIRNLPALMTVLDLVLVPEVAPQVWLHCPNSVHCDSRQSPVQTT